MATPLYTLMNIIKLCNKLGITIALSTKTVESGEVEPEQYEIRWVGRMMFLGPLDRVSDFVRGYATAKGLLW